MPPSVSVGTVGGGAPAVVDPVGAVTPAGAGFSIEWWIGADDRWRVPANEVAVRQHRVGDVPVVETRMRVPGGDAIQRTYGVAGAGRPLVLEVENRSPAPFVLAFAIRGAQRVVADGACVVVDGAFALSTVRAPSRWACTVGAPVLVPVTTGRAETGPFTGARDRAARLEAAFLHPVAHRTTLRAALVSGRRVSPVDPRTLPDAASVTAGWSRVLDRGMQVRLPDVALERRVRAARAEVLLRGQSSAPGSVVVAALEDWGFDDEAARAWRHLGLRERRRAAQRPEPTHWGDVAATVDDAGFLVASRRLLVDDSEPDTVALSTDYPTAWRGASLEVHDAPVRGGRLSYALRWHGARPALLWDAPPGVRVRVPGLDPRWVSHEPHGEVLLDAA